jgi:hypothetical protein
MSDRSTAHKAVAAPHRYSLVAAASVLSSFGVKNQVKTEGMLPWQEESWGYYDRVGEFRFGVGWLANSMSRVNLGAARPPRQVGDEPTLIDVDGADTTPEEKIAAQFVASIGGGASGQGQLLAGFGQHLSIAGLGWLVAEPAAGSDTYKTWGIHSQDSIKIEGQGLNQKVFIREGASNEDWRLLHEDALIVKAWRKHPRRSWEPDAPVRAVLPVLDQIDLLGAHITATGRSRLAGAGLLAIPAEAEWPTAPEAKEGEEQQTGFDYFVEQLIIAMTTPIRDRDNASGVVPLTIAIPGEYISMLQHITFSTPFDAKVTELMDKAISRLALGMDMPPEVLTGMAGVNHWTAWQVEETAVTLHIEPAAEIACQALTEGFLAPALAAAGIDPAVAMVWYDTSDLTAPPDKSGNAILAYDRLEISGDALRRETGLNDDDKPDGSEKRLRTLMALAQYPQFIPALQALLGVDAVPDPAAAPPAPTEPTQEPVDPAPVDAPPPPNDRGTPDPADRPDGNRDAALLAASDGIVYRAMERAGSRLRSSIGKTTTGGPASVSCDNATELHLSYDPTIYADLDGLLDGAFTRITELSITLGIDADAWTITLNAYCRALLASQRPHTMGALAQALGVTV